MPDPILVAIAAALAGKAAGAVAGGGGSALRSMVDMVRRRFAGETEVLDAIGSDAPNADADADADAAADTTGEKADVLVTALDRATADDPEFAERLRTLWDQARTELHADRGGVVNEVSGTVSGHVVQARDVTGGISFGDAPRQADRAGQ